ncbi:response regulator [Variovorax saccharolyticus]|uniref:response regulator n=1 Tax=Variovorax saccharolyticus TaxID=3053516 RepID=UPI00257796C1|nr:response regulator [Variovorax sp. J31P216]MDM0024386.1 response regulator [Variovorax sp. J31P216]
MSSPGPSRIVYVIDGDAAVREALARLLDAAGLEPRPCVSVEEFLAEVKADPMACVLLDVPGAWGGDAATRTSWQAIAGKLPVIALSSSDGPVVRRRAREMGARHFFRKPVDAAALLDSIDWVAHGDARDAPL